MKKENTKTFTFTIDRFFRWRLISRVIETGIPYVRDHEMGCRDIESIYEILTPSRFKMMVAVIRYKPSTLAELSHILDTPFKETLDTACALEAFGYLRLVKAKNRDQVLSRPVARYTKFSIDLDPAPWPSPKI